MAKAKVPVFHIHGDSDKVVPLDKNTAVLAKRYTEFGGVSIFSPRVGFFPSPERHYVVTTQLAVNW